MRYQQESEEQRFLNMKLLFIRKKTAQLGNLHTRGGGGGEGGGTGMGSL